MKILLVGNGGREHALAWRLAQSESAPILYATRPNAGLAKIVEAVDLGVDQIEEHELLAQSAQPDPEAGETARLVCDGDACERPRK